MRRPAVLLPAAFTLAGVSLALGVGGAALSGRLRTLAERCWAGGVAPAAALGQAEGVALVVLATVLAAAGAALVAGAALRQRWLKGAPSSGSGRGGAAVLLLVPLALLLFGPWERLLGQPAAGSGAALGLLGWVAIAGVMTAAVAGVWELLGER